MVSSHKTAWEKIYKDYRLKGEKKQLVDEGIHPDFIRLIKRGRFPVKAALDIGCGMGDYLKLLKDRGFVVEGIDSSKEAVTSTKKILRQHQGIRLADMYRCHIPKNRYGFIFSIRTIHHGSKEQIGHLMEEIYKGLKKRGTIFLTVPTYKTLDRWKTFKNITILSDGTFIPRTGVEKGLVHSIFKKEEIKSLLAKFRTVSIKEDSRNRWVVSAVK